VTEVELQGGVNVVVRTGDRVHRPVGPWTPNVHALLRHVRAQGFTGAPTVHGLDSEGREVLDFIPGEVCALPLAGSAASAGALASAAALLRRYHDATTGFVPAHPHGWQLPSRAPAEVVCHGDFAPYNVVLEGERAIALIDFDTAHPAPRAWDVAYALYRWAPLLHPDNPECVGSFEAQAARAADFCDAYGLAAHERTGLPALVVERLLALAAFIEARAALGDIAFQGHLAAGHPSLYRRDAAHLAARLDRLAAALLR
jgi:Ser/Thr protein kinase RdoA (MazF antagonist)